MITPKVLIVNDDPGSLLAMESLLTSGANFPGEYEVITAQSGEEALRQVLHHDFAVILLDVNMPGMDGFDTAEAIHSHPRSASIPIIFVTAHYADEINRLKGYQKGAADYLFTPVIPQILQSKVAVFIELAKKRFELQEKTLELEELNHDLRVQRMQDLERINARLEAEIVVRKQAEQREHELATRDPLTGLLNRRSLIERLEHAISIAARYKKHLAVMFIDLDKFKNINDTLGHEAGDELLKQMAARITSAVRESDLVARLGGDEFVVLMEGMASYPDAAKVAEKIVQANTKAYSICSQDIRMSATIGISLYPQDGTTMQALMNSADSAMYGAKHQQRGSIQFFQYKNSKVIEESTNEGATSDGHADRNN